MATKRNRDIACSCFDSKTDGQFDIISATRKGHVECVEKLIAQGCELEVVETEESFGDHFFPPMKNTALTIAATKGDTCLVKILLDAGMNVDGYIVGHDDTLCPLYEACLQDQMEAAKALIEAGANCTPLCGPFTTCSEPPLHLVARNGDVSVMKLLVNGGASVNLTDGGRTALFEAAYQGNVEIVDYLISVGANLNIGTDQGETPLMAASLTDDDDYNKCVQLLIRAGADINVRAPLGLPDYPPAPPRRRQTALSCAASYDNKVVMEMLISANANMLYECFECTRWDCGGCGEAEGLPEALFYAFHNDREPDVDCINLLYAAGIEIPFYMVVDMRTQMKANLGWDEETVNGILRNYETFLPLKELCRRRIRRELQDIFDPCADRTGYKNLFVAVPRLPLPKIIKDYLLFNIEPQSPWDPLPDTK